MVNIIVKMREKKKKSRSNLDHKRIVSNRTGSRNCSDQRRQWSDNTIILRIKVTFYQDPLLARGRPLQVRVADNTLMPVYT